MKYIEKLSSGLGHITDKYFFLTSVCILFFVIANMLNRINLIQSNET